MSALTLQLRQVEQTFRNIHRERMRGLPFLNPALEVEAVGFTPWVHGYIGVLITPWFVNLMLLTSKGAWGDLQVGSKVTHRFDSGAYEFTVGEEPHIGSYQMCSLFSPAQAFADHAAAVATAKEVMQGLMDRDNREGLTLHEEVIRKAWQGEAGATNPGATQAEEPTLSKKMAGPMSRRDFLRGGRVQR